MSRLICEKCNQELDPKTLIANNVYNCPKCGLVESIQSQNPILQPRYWGENITATLEGSVLTLRGEVKGSGIDESTSSEHMKNVSELKITGTIEYINASVFKGIQSLNLVYIDSDDFGHIGHRAFENCRHLERVVLNGCKQLRTINSDTFWGCSALKYINIPKGTKKLLNGAFAYCKSLESMDFPEGLELIGNEAFIGCSSLKKLDIPKTVSCIGSKAFYDCDSITELKIPRPSEISLGDHALPKNLTKRKYHEPNRTKKVLWFSRHKMTDDQINSLRNKIGEFELIQVDKTIESTREIRDKIETADVLAVVAPPELLSEFFDYCNEDNGKILIFAESERVLIKSEDGSESKAIFSFKRWVKIQKFEYETCTFCN